MDFTNHQILIHQLPSIEDSEFQPLEKKYLLVSRISYGISTFIILILGAAAFYFIQKIQISTAIICVAASFLTLTIIGWIGNTLSFKHSGYVTREKDILYRRGWIIRKTSAVPLKRIQHVSVQSGPIERKFGLASISIFTAGSSAADFTIRGITAETAKRMKEWITKQPDGEND